MVKYTDIENQAFVKSALIDGIIEIEFLKADGSKRKMKATLQESLVPHVEVDTERKINPDTQVVWDTDRNGWRSFRWDRLQGINANTE
jgi:hypothetical protein